VDEPQTWSNRIGLTRGKAAIVVVLGVTLVVVIYVKYGPSMGSNRSGGLVGAFIARAAPRSGSATPGSAAANSQQPASNAGRLFSTAADASRWKSPDLSIVLAYDPFALPSAFPSSLQASGASRAQDAVVVAAEAADADQMAAALESLRVELEQLQQRGVHVIVRGRDQDEYVAMIGDRTLHVGDVISGFTVTAIEADHVRVERKIQK
jgi:hypothetical protein